MALAILGGWAGEATAGSWTGWTWRNPLPQGDDLLAVTYGGGQFVAVGVGGTILSSPDGQNWAEADSGTDMDLFGVTYGNGLFVAVGEGVILTSPDGASWTRGSCACAPGYLYAVTYGGGRFVAVGSDYMGAPFAAVSTDGVNWSPATLPEGLWTEINGVAYGGRSFVAVTSDGRVLTSPDGDSWSPQDTGTGAWLSGVAHGNGVWVAVGGADQGGQWQGVALRSSDGVNWTTETLPSPVMDLWGVAFVNGAFLAVGPDGTMLSSTDGQTWSQLDTGGTESLMGVAYGSGRYVAVGWAGALLSSADGQG